MPNRQAQSKSLFAAAFVCVFCLAAGASRAEEWTQFGGPNCQGVSSEEIMLFPPAEHWTASIGLGYTSVVVYDGCVYAFGQDPSTVYTDVANHVRDADNFGIDIVRCIDVASGQTLWTFGYAAISQQGPFSGGFTPLHPDADECGPRASPLVDGDLVYTISTDGHCWCLDRHSGRPVWYRNTADQFGGPLRVYGVCSSPVIHGGNVIIDLGYRCVAVNKLTGEIVWECDTGSTGFAAPSALIVTLGGVDCVLFGDKTIVCLDAATGAKLWEYAMGRTAIATHVLDGTRLFYSTYPNPGACAAVDLSLAGASPVWSGSVRTYHLSSVAYNGDLYAMDNSGTEYYGSDGSDTAATTDDIVSSLKSIDLATGTVNWTEEHMGWANPLVVGDELLILKEDGQLLHVDVSSTYSELGAFAAVDPVCWTLPSVSGGRVYVRNYDGDLKCFFIAPAVSIEAVDAEALETSDAATFRIARTSAVPASPSASLLTVDLAIGGTGVRGTEYGLAGGSVTAGVSAASVTIPGGQSYVDVTLNALANGDAVDHTAILSVASKPGEYIAASNNAASVVIFDQGYVVPTVAASADDGGAYALEGGTDNAVVTLTRDGQTTQPLVVDVSVVPAPSSTTFLLVGVTNDKVVIPAGAASVEVTLVAVDDAAANGDRTVLVSVLDASAFYDRDGAAYEVLVTIVDDDDAQSDVADGDGMDDGWELCHWGSTTASDGTTDADGDEMLDGDEYAAGTNPRETDSDRDGSDDGWEVASGTDPADAFAHPATARPLEEEGPPGGGGNGCAASGAPMAFALLLLVCVVLLVRTMTAGIRR
jgi:outer membrane protein assembly factor BamB